MEMKSVFEIQNETINWLWMMGNNKLNAGQDMP